MASYSGALAILKHGGETGKGEGALLQKSAARTLARWHAGHGCWEGATAYGSTTECHGTVPSLLVEPCSTTLGHITARVGPVNQVLP